jgi:hypothetical protein
MLEVTISVTAALQLSWLALILALSVVAEATCFKRRCGCSLIFSACSEASHHRPCATHGCSGAGRLLFVYLAIPIEIIPDFFPVLGYAENAIIVVLVLRSVCRRVGFGEILTRPQPATAE